ncbi:hypothetical protein [Desulfatiferula olefinivorans]
MTLVKRLMRALSVVCAVWLSSLGAPCFAGPDAVGKSPVTLHQDTVTPGITNPFQQAAPTLTGVFPNTLTQGQALSVTLSGANLSSAMGIRLGDGIGTSNYHMINDTQASVMLSVSAQAAPGKRQVSILYKDQLRPTPVYVTVNPLYVPPTVQSLAPNALSRGKSYNVVITGSNLSGVKGLDCGAGITAKGLKTSAASPNMLTCTLDVAQTASPGARIVKAVDEKGSHAGAATVTVLAGLSGVEVMTDMVIMPDTPQPDMPPSAAPQPVAPPKPVVKVGGMTPNRWFAGKTYEVSIFGTDVDEDTLLHLEDGITIENIDVKAAGYTTMTIRVDAKAYGQKRLKMRQNTFHAWADTGLSGYVIPYTYQAPVLSAAIKHTAIEDIKIVKGVIELEKPEFGDLWIMENAWHDSGIPTSDDANVFTWEEKQAGGSQWYELRIISTSGKVLVTRKIEGSPLPDSFYVPDVAFLTEMFAAIRPDDDPGKITTTVSGTDGVKRTTFKPDAATIAAAGFSAAAGTSSGSSYGPRTDEDYIETHKDEIDCYWEVAGFKRLMSYTYSSQAGKYLPVTSDVETAVSERWPLKLPQYSPTGLICSSANTVTQLNINPANDDIGGTVEGDNLFVGQDLRLTGDFTLEGCPWSIASTPVYDDPETSYMPTDPSTSTSNASQSTVIPTYTVMGWQLDNVFIDWGDGTFDRPYVVPRDVVTSIGSKVDKDPTGVLSLSIIHNYRYAQKFPVRLFVLPREEAGKIHSIVQAAKAPVGGSVYQETRVSDPLYGERLFASLSHTVTETAGPVAAGVSKNKTVAVVNNLGFEAPGSNAFLLYCQPKVIDVRPDPAATGDLHLIDLSISGFSGQEATSDGVIMIDSPVSVGVGKTMTLPDHEKKTLPPIKKTSETLTFSAAPGMSAAMVVENSAAGLVGNVHPSSDAVASTCDAGLYATVRLEYFGLGRINLIWKVDDIEIAHTVEEVGPSPIRTELDDDSQYTEPERHGFVSFQSPNLPLSVAGLHRLSVETSVVGFENAEYRPAVPGGQHGGVYLDGIPGSPEYYLYVKRAAAPKTYWVQTPSPGRPCAFYFPVSGGKTFVVSNLQNRITKKNGMFSGEGTLYFSLPDGPSSIKEHFVDIHISNWQVDENYVVTKGYINEINIGKTMDELPAVSAVLKKLKGQANEPLTATMDVKVRDSGLHRVGATLPPEWLNAEAALVPEDGWYAEGQTMPETEIYWSDFRISSNDVILDLSWKRGDAPVSDDTLTIPGLGGTPATQVTLPSGNTSVTLPQSGSSTAKTKSSKNKPITAQDSIVSSMTQDMGVPQAAYFIPWAGVNLGTARIYPYLFNLADLTVDAKGWSITDRGIVGKARFNQFEYKLGDGSISFDAIDIESGDHHLEANYKGVKVHIPWPDVTLDGGDATVSYTQGEEAANIAFHFNVTDKVVEEYDNVTMSVAVKGFEKRGSGWGILTDTTFDFTDGQDPFATAVLTDLFFNVFGVAHFTDSGDQAKNRFIPFDRATTFGKTDFTLAGLNVHAQTDFQKEERLSFLFNGRIRFGDAFNAPDVNVTYGIDRPPGKDIQATGPSHSKITLCSDFHPAGEPLSSIEVSPTLDLSGGGTTVYDVPDEDNPVVAFLLPSAWAATPVTDTFRGDVNPEMFGVTLPAAVRAKFRYGKHNGQTYWLTHLSGSGIDVPIFTSGVNLKAVEGGIAHGFNANVFDGDPMEAIPEGDDTFYSAGVTIGSPSSVGNIYSLRGVLTVRMTDVLIKITCNPVYIFGINVGGGYFAYLNKEFYGSIHGNLSLYGGVLKCEIPNIPFDENNPGKIGQVGLHFSDSEWEIHAGLPNDPVEITLFNRAGVAGFYQFGYPVGYHVGGHLGFDTKKLCLKLFAARAYADANMSVGIAPGSLDGHFSIGGGLHAYVPCSGDIWDDGFSKSIGVDVKAPPLSMKGVIRFGVPKWVPGPSRYTFRFGI